MRFHIYQSSNGYDAVAKTQNVDGYIGHSYRALPGAKLACRRWWLSPEAARDRLVMGITPDYRIKWRQLIDNDSNVWWEGVVTPTIKGNM